LFRSDELAASRDFLVPTKLGFEAYGGLRAAISLARLWRDQGKMSEARELLAPVYGVVYGGFDTRDLKEAKAMLEDLVF
jgi:predicted ATPase